MAFYGIFWDTSTYPFRDDCVNIIVCVNEDEISLSLLPYK
jgi:hypothetical protein